ncbi:hypothetical protein [uncultured Duncaniella sp.]|uniref:hypothetical protein n=1 Tax=uncultured Duncaniella sp. TaxID=2768039 RepID=UPI00261C819F|nr:hypothetical protein [uncultured Duncaniella sp.]
MTDFSTLRTKVEALKAEVVNNSITPLSLGSLLDELIDLIATTDISDRAPVIDLLTLWRDKLVSPSPASGSAPDIITAITPESTPQSFRLLPDTMSVADGSRSSASPIPIPLATDDKAGIISAGFFSSVTAFTSPVRVSSEEELERMVKAGECEKNRIYYTEETD